MDKAREITLNQFLDISREMLKSADNNDWEKLPDLEQERKRLMQPFFESNITFSDSKKVEQTIKGVLQINTEIEQLAQKEKVSIGQQLHGMKKKQNVQSAYLQNK